MNLAEAATADAHKLRPAAGRNPMEVLMSFLTQGLWRNPVAPRAEQIDVPALAGAVLRHAGRIARLVLSRRVRSDRRGVAPCGC